MSWWQALAQAGPAVLKFGENVFTSAMNVHEKRQDRRFQRNMSNTAHQREVDDLRAAGLNPMLSANHGASTPPGSAAQIQPSGAADTLISGMALKKNIELQNAQINDINSAAKLKQAEAGDILATQETRINQMKALIDEASSRKDLNVQQKNNLEKLNPKILEKVSAELNQIEAVIEETKLKTKHSALGINKAQAESDYYNTWLGKNSMYIKQITDILAPVLGVASAASIARSLIQGLLKQKSGKKTFSNKDWLEGQSGELIK